MYEKNSSKTLRLPMSLKLCRKLIEECACGWLPISVSSCWVIDRCSRGVLRPYQAQSAINPSVGKLLQMSACRQPKRNVSKPMRGGVTTEPKLSPMVCSPCTNAQRFCGNQLSKTPADTGKMAPWES